MQSSRVKRRRWWIAGLAAGAMAGLLAPSCAAPSAPVAGATGTARPDLAVRRGDFLTQLLLTGEVKASRFTPLVVPRTPARAVQIRWMVEDGTLVANAGVVIEFDNSSIISSIEDLRAAADARRSEVERQRAANEALLAEKQFEVDKKRLQLQEAQIVADVPPEVLPRREWQQRQTGLERAGAWLAQAEDETEAARRGAEADLGIAEIERQKAERELRSAEEALDMLVIKAPCAGPFLVGTGWNGRRFRVGDTVWPGWEVGLIPDVGEMEVHAWVTDVDDGRIKTGAPALCTLDAHPNEPFSGRVKTISQAAQERSEKGGRRAFKVVVGLGGAAPALLRPGMSVRVEVEMARLSGVLLAPRVALNLADSPPRAVLRGGEERPVVVGPCGAQECVVEDGLSEGQQLQAAGGRA